MKLKEGFKLRSVCGYNVVVAEGLKNIKFNKMLVLNESAKFLWEEFYGKESFSQPDLAAKLVEHYGIDEATANTDSTKLVESWRNAGVLDE